MSITEHFIGEIVMFAGNYPPKGWAFCDGTVLAVSQNQTLFAVIGDMYGGDGRTSFALPDLKARFPMHRSDIYRQGWMGGYPEIKLNIAHLPSHTHDMMASNKEATAQVPTGNVLADPNSGLDTNIYGSGHVPADLTTMNSNSLSPAGGTSSLPLYPPYTTLNFIICMDGLFPSRN